MSASDDLKFEATALCLGLPGAPLGSCDEEEAPPKTVGKRGYSETVDFKLQLPDEEPFPVDPAKKASNGNINGYLSQNPSKPPKAQIVGWPPVRSCRKTITEQNGAGAAFVKVCMDGAPYLRKVDLKMYKSYNELSDSLAKMFGSFTTGTNKRNAGMIDFMNLLNISDYVPTYEDKDGDWMLVGDVPWEMFVESCKRVRIMKGSEAQGLAPKAVQKFSNSR